MRFVLAIIMFFVVLLITRQFRQWSGPTSVDYKL